MSKTNLKQKAKELLILVRKLAETPGLTWVDANNAVYAPGGALVRLFPTREDREAFAKLPEHKQIDELIDSLPEPPVRPEPKEYNAKFYLEIPD